VERARDGAIAADRLPRFEPGRERDALIRVRNLRGTRDSCGYIARGRERRSNAGRRAAVSALLRRDVACLDQPFAVHAHEHVHTAPDGATRGGWSWPLDANIVDQYAS
jgi:hypothetical protein